MSTIVEVQAGRGANVAVRSAASAVAAEVVMAISAAMAMLRLGRTDQPGSGHASSGKEQTLST